MRLGQQTLLLRRAAVQPEHSASASSPSSASGTAPSSRPCVRISLVAHLALTLVTLVPWEAKRREGERESKGSSTSTRSKVWLVSPAEHWRAPEEGGANGKGEARETTSYLTYFRVTITNSRLGCWHHLVSLILVLLLPSPSPQGTKHPGFSP